MASEEAGGFPTLLVGITPGQQPEVLHAAVDLAARLGAFLLFAYVDEASFLPDWDPERPAHRLTLRAGASDKDDDEAVLSRFSAPIAAALATAPAGLHPLPWTVRRLTGDPASALARLGAEIDAGMIIVGSPGRGVSHRISEALAGSVGAWLIHHQAKPVLVVPVGK